MFCPECRAEYRPGFKRCSDCEVDLVAELPKSESGDSAQISNLWTGKDQGRCVEICERLRAVGIPYKVEQSRHQYLQRVDEKYRISVPSELFQRARRVVKNGR
jgi:hypothetical protein